jgi:hypothetical protein
MSVKKIEIKKNEIKESINSPRDIIIFLSPDCTVIGDVQASTILAVGNLKIKGSAYINTSIEVLGNLEVSGNLHVNDSIEIEGSLTAESLDRCRYLGVKKGVNIKVISAGIPSALARYQLERHSLSYPEGFPEKFFNPGEKK